MREKNAKKEKQPTPQVVSETPKRRGRPPKIKPELPKTPETPAVIPEKKAENNSGRIYKRPPFIETNITGPELLVVSILFAMYEELVGIGLRLERPDASLEELQNEFAQHETLGFIRGMVFPTLKKKNADKPYDAPMASVFSKILNYKLEGQAS